MAPLTICGLCSTNPSKYKCPTCSIAYCSLICYKPHKVVHLSGPPSPTLTTTTTTSTSEPPPPSAPQSTIPKARKPDKFSPLLESTEIKSLLSASPGLQARLTDVHAATVEPLDAEFVRDRFGNMLWTQEKADRRALELLGDMRQGDWQLNEFIKKVVATIDGGDSNSGGGGGGGQR